LKNNQKEKKQLETKTMDHPGGNAPVNRGPEGKDETRFWKSFLG